MEQSYVYLLTNRKQGVLYIGVTSDLVKRIWQHREGLAEGFTLDGSKGLGLSIVQALVTGELGGTLDVGPGDHGRGTRFHLQIPLATASATQVVEPS